MNSHKLRSLVFVLLATLLLPLLAACGGAPAATVQEPINNGLSPGGAMPTAAVAERTDATGAAPVNAPADGAGVAPVAPPVMPAATMLPEKPAAEPATGAEAIAPPPADAAAGGPTGAAPPVSAPPVIPPIRPNNQQQAVPLKAGEVDDNVDFADYRQYLASYSSPYVHPVDTSERYILSITNDRQQPVLDARVRIFDGQNQVFEGRTYAGGKTIFLPRALNVTPQSQSLRVVVDKGNSSVEGTLNRGQDGTFSYVLPGAQALPQNPRLDVLFLLDATGSMGDEIARIQSTLVSIAERIDQIQPRPEVRFGLVAYRDQGDEYVTRLYSNFTGDVQNFRLSLMQVRADGGGDTPEDLNAGLQSAVQQMSWSDDAVRLIFLVADAPAHLDYGQDFDYIASARTAVSKGVKIYPIAASNTDPDAEYQFRQLAQLTMASFIFLTYQSGQESGTPGDTTSHNVDPAAFTVERLDDLVVQVIQRELARASGAN